MTSGWNSSGFSSASAPPGSSRELDVRSPPVHTSSSKLPAARSVWTLSEYYREKPVEMIHLIQNSASKAGMKESMSEPRAQHRKVTSSPSS